MRIVWLMIVLLAVAVVWIDFGLSRGQATSAMQLSQLYDSISATMLTLIALTLSFWFVATRNKSDTPQNPGPDPE